MALQGTLDTFALPDVLRLSGGRGTGAVWVESGEVVAIEAAHAPHALDAVEALFELLRFEDGAFTFDVDLVHDDPAPATEVESLLSGAEAQLVEWRAIEAVVPSLDAWVALRADLSTSEVVIDRERWATLVAVGAGATVRRVGDELCLSEMAVSRAVKALVELGVAEVDATAPPDAVTEPGQGADAPVRDPAHQVHRAPAPAVGATAPPAARPTPTFDLSDPRTGEIPEPAGSTGPEGWTGSPEPTRAGTEVDGDLARQLGNLSPRAAEAVRAATTATTADERAAALAEAEAVAADEDDSVNRGLLLKFLSSVKT